MALNQMGVLLGKQGKFQEGRKVLVQAFEMSQKRRMLTLMGHNRWYITELETQAGNHAKAVEHLYEFIDIKDTLLNNQVKGKVAFYQEKFKAGERELEIARLAQSDAENKANMNRQRLTVAIAVSILVITILLGAFILISYLHSLRSQRLLTAKNLQLQNLTQEAQFERGRAEEANRAKTAFLANMTHEIRTPLTGLISITDLLRYTPLSSEQGEYVGLMRRSGENLIRIVDEILDFSKIEAGKMDLEETAFDLFELLDEILLLFSSQRSDKNLDLACLIDPNIPQKVKGDPHKLRQVMFNLIGNAMKFTERGGVFVSFSLLPNGSIDEKLLIHAEVKDTGIGIPKEQQERLFNEFEQAEAGITRKYGGTGLGLNISSRLINLMDGSLELESDSGQGSRFYFDFKLGRVHATNDSPQPSKFDNWKNKTVLIAEKGVWSKKTLVAWFSSMGARTIYAEDLPTIRKYIDQQAIDLLIYGLDCEHVYDVLKDRPSHWPTYSIYRK